VASALPKESLVKPRARLAAVEEALEESDFDDKTLEKCEIESRHYVKSTKTKQQKLLRPPRCLAVHINRSIFDPNNGYMVKNPAPVNFPTLLDLGPWTMGSAGSGDTDLDSGVESRDIEYWTSKPGHSQVSGSDGHSKNTGPIYKLRSVVVHRGHHDSGHYICYKQRPWRNPKLSGEDATTEGDATQPLTNMSLVGKRSSANLPQKKTTTMCLCSGGALATRQSTRSPRTTLPRVNREVYSCSSTKWSTRRCALPQSTRRRHRWMLS